MASNAAFGMAYSAFLPVLLPAYLLSVGGTPTDVGVAMSMVGLFALVGPTVGGFASRYGAYRMVQAVGVLALGAGYAVLALAKGDSFTIVLAVGIIGIGAAALLVVNPVFIVGGGLGPALQARQLMFLQLNLDIGKIAGGMVLAAMAAASLSYDEQFWVAAGLLGLLAIFAWLVSGRASMRVARAQDRAERHAQTDKTGKIPLRKLLGGLFGVTLLAMLLATVMSTFISSQYSNIFSSVFGLSETKIASMVSVSGLVGIGLYFVAGRWLGRSDPVIVWAFGNGVRGVGGLTLALLGAVGRSPFVAILGAYLLVEACAAFSRIAQAPVAVRFAPVGAAVATGWLAAASALGQASGSIGAGVLADVTGSFEILLWVAGAVGVVSGLIGFLVLLPASRRRSKDPQPPSEVANVGGAGQAEIAR